MPFTFSHPAIVLPLRNLKIFSCTGLIVGSMMPDFEYFLRMRIVGEHGHTALGVYYFDLPIGFLFTYIYHYCIRNTFIDHLPNFFRKRFILFKQFNWNNYLKEHFFVVVCSLLLGVYSHLFWDAFTHEYGYFVQKIPILKETIFKRPIYNILQHLSSIVGAWLIYYSIKKMPVACNLNVYTNNVMIYWFWIVFFTGSFTLIRFYNNMHLWMIGNIIVTTIMNFFLAMLLINFIYKTFRKNNV
ncbi:DUF4184 family protein [Apibacter muscae]|uniref:DUF4184 family protein n=1 Tax=Apibacter muscae TaxID=2509004 RepID=UPI0011ABC29B|nr:DUF4184 family protein [Apibacter muscae]TWP24343.1 DUF4184 family protein [Apibacter muscae]